MKNATLKEVCEIAGVTRRAVQGYEKAELVTPSSKNKYGHLLYDEKTIEQIKTIKQYQDFGFTIKEIKSLLEYSEETYMDIMVQKLCKMKEERCKLDRNIEIAERLIAEKRK